MSAKKYQKQARSQTKWNIFERANYVIFLVGVGVIVLGYLAMMQGPHNSFWSLHLAPILLVLGYCVFVPWAILKHTRQPKSD